MSSNTRRTFQIPLLDNDCLDVDRDQKELSSGSLFKAHRHEVKLNKQSPKKQNPVPSVTNSTGSTQSASGSMPNVTAKGVVLTGPAQSSNQRSLGIKTLHEVSKAIAADQLAVSKSVVRSVPDPSSKSIPSAVGNVTSGANQPAVPSSSATQTSASAVLSTGSSGSVQPPKPTGSSNSLIVSPRQRGNPILKFVRNVPWEFGDIVPDYQLGKTSCALFLSLRYHNLNPNYVHGRLKQLGHSFDLRVLLAQVDIKDPHHALKELAQICLLSDTTLILAFSAEEAGRYLETFKAYENKPPDLIMEKTESNFLSQFTDCVTSTRKVNKTDAITLLTTFGSFAEIAKQSEEHLSLCPGFGPNKAKRLHEVLNEPFLKSKKKLKSTKSDGDEKSAASSSRGSSVT